MCVTFHIYQKALKYTFIIHGRHTHTLTNARTDYAYIVDRVLWNNISLWNAFSLNYVTIKINICVYIRHKYVCTQSLYTTFHIHEKMRKERRKAVGGSRVNNEYISFESPTNCMKIVYSVNDFTLWRLFSRFSIHLFGLAPNESECRWQNFCYIHSTVFYVLRMYICTPAVL